MMPESEIILDGSIPNTGVADAAQEVAPTENAWEQFERGRLSRRQVLKKLGMTSAMAAFALFSVDDLARMVGKAMQQRAADNKVTEQVAQELQQAGIALAVTDYSFCWASGCKDPSNCNPNGYTWLSCAGCGFISGCVKEVFNCQKSGDLEACMKCCQNQNAACQQSGSGYSCPTLMTGCQNNCGGA